MACVDIELRGIRTFLNFWFGMKNTPKAYLTLGYLYLFLDYM